MFAVGAPCMPAATAVLGADLERQAPQDTLCEEQNVVESIAAESASAENLDAPAEGSWPRRRGDWDLAVDELCLRTSVRLGAYAWVNSAFKEAATAEEISSTVEAAEFLFWTTRRES